MLNTMIAILVEKLILTEEEGRALVEKLKYATLPGDYGTSRAQVKKFFDQITKGK